MASKEVKLSDYLTDGYFQGLIGLNNALIMDNLSLIQYRQKMFELNKVYSEMLHELQAIEG